MLTKTRTLSSRLSAAIPHRTNRAVFKHGKLAHSSMSNIMGQGRDKIGSPLRDHTRWIYRILPSSSMAFPLPYSLLTYLCSIRRLGTFSGSRKVLSCGGTERYLTKWFASKSFRSLSSLFSSSSHTALSWHIIPKETLVACHLQHY